MKTGSAIFYILLIIMLLASLGAAAFFYLDLDEQKSRVAQLESDLDSAKLILQGTKDKLTQKEKEALFLDQKNKMLAEEISELKKKADNLALAKSALDEQINQLDAKKKMLEVQLTQVMKSAQEQISLKEQDLKKRISTEVTKAAQERQALDKQLKSSEVLVQNLLQANDELRQQLEKNKIVLEGLQRDKLGVELLSTRDALQQKEAELGKIISENERLTESFQQAEKAKEDIETQLTQEKNELETQFIQEKTELQEDLAQVQEELKSQTAKFHYNLGLLYDQSQRHEEALSEYQKALKWAPDDPDVHYNLGVLYDEAIKDERKAIYHYKAYLQLCPTARDTEKVELWIRKAEERLQWGGVNYLKR